ncbi:hypothetical protein METBISCDRAFT_16004 [Metschnikowia bicuspidata]|uniref:SUN domain-containing protein n=1 Tax=Metschnikowia bicuspidata TaxID=27322 RepID=A0A4P9ZCV1_9ASCO|nr:hypothetical protein METBISCDRAFT_16004 [Metschnikowia bicuspidata]
MGDFSRIPVYRGDTDDDASIHLHSRVGPAKPMSYQKYDHQIMEILNDSGQRDPEDDFDARARELNTGFQKFAESSPFESDSEGDLTHVEDEPDFGRKVTRKSVHSSKQNPNEPEERFALSIFNPSILGYICGVVLFFIILWRLSKSHNSATQVDTTSVNARIDEVSQRVGALKEISTALDQQVDLISVKQDSFVNSVLLRIATFEQTLQDLQNNAVDEARVHQIEAELGAFRKQLDAGLLVISQNPEELEQKVQRISGDLAQLLRLNHDVLVIKKEIVNELVKRLPSLVPVYMKDNKVHYVPEFYDFMVNFVGSVSGAGNSTLTWQDFMSSHGPQFKTYIKNLFDTADVKFLSKAQFEESLHELLASNNRALISKINSILDKIDLLRNSTSIDLGASGNRIVLDNLLEVVSKGSMKVNFADYKLGSRILGFLTTTGSDSYKKRSLARTVFLGWYDYLTSSGLRSAAKMKFNANNILVDGGQYWQCDSRKCSVAVRLSSPVILTDLILNNPLAGRPEGLQVPEMISIYIKPRKRLDAARLELHLESRLNSPYQKIDNKYLSKFYKVKDLLLKGSGSTEHIKLPTSIINMRIPVRDIYLEISSRQGFTGLFNLKAYGITEFNSFRYAEKFESILDRLGEDEFTEESANSRFLFDRNANLGEDYIL